MSPLPPGPETRRPRRHLLLRRGLFHRQPDGEKTIITIANMCKRKSNRPLHLIIALLAASGLILSACGVIRTTYRLTKGTVVMAYKVTKFAGSTVYTVG